MKIARIARFALIFTVAGTPAACQQTTTPEKHEETAATSAPDAKPGLSLSEAKLVLPIIAGRPGAVYVKVTNGGDKPATIVSAYVEGAASAEIHNTSGGSMAATDRVDVEPGKTVEFAPGGLHIMVFDLPDEFRNGGTTELTLTFSDGDKISAPLAITTMAAGDMAEMDHGAKH